MGATIFEMATLHPLPRPSRLVLALLPVPSRLQRRAFNPNHTPSSWLSTPPSPYSIPPTFKVYTTTSNLISSASTSVFDKSEDEFDWYSEWYAVAPVCDLDKRVPHGKRILGIDVVVWWDRNLAQWKVFEDRCPHRLAPLSEGRIDSWGRLQCVYHGWCFNGLGSCQLIPQAPPDAPPIHTSKKACVASYPCTVQNDILWFWPSSDPQYQDILTKKQPPYIPELDDPSYTSSMGTRDINYGYEILIENLMDPAHVPYAHYGIMRMPVDKNRPKADREGGKPLDFTVQKLDKNGFLAKQERGFNKFIPPCVFYAIPKSVTNRDNENEDQSTFKEKDSEEKQRRLLLIFICVPVSPGKSRLIWTFPRNFGVWIDKIVPRWMFHIGQNLILDSDLYLLHLEERKIKEIGDRNWQKACYVPTKSDALVVAFRKWVNKHAGGGVDWRQKFDGILPPTPPREVLMDRYWTHVVNCSSCNAAYKGLQVAETMLQVLCVGLIGAVGLLRQEAMTSVQRSALFAAALICFAASKWLSNFIYKNFHYHDYSHALK